MLYPTAFYYREELDDKARPMINPDELDPPRPTLKPLDLQQMAVQELKDYIAALENEIRRAQEMIAKKEAHKSGIDSLFGTPKG